MARLPRLPAQTAIVDPKTGRPTQAFTVWVQRFAEAQEATDAAQDDVTDDLAEQLALIQAAQAAADGALSEAQATMPDIPSVTIHADHTGTVTGSQLPRNIAATRYDGATNVTTSSAWSFTTVSGSITATIGAATGILNVTALDSTSVVEITSVHDSITRSRRVTITKQLAPVPTGGGVTDSASDSTISNSTSSSYGSTMGGPLVITCGASGTIELSAPLEYLPDAAMAAGTYTAYGRWRWRVSGGGAWTDGTENTAYLPSLKDADGYVSNGAITVSETVNGLVAATDYEAELQLRDAVGATIGYTGTASATTS